MHFPSRRLLGPGLLVVAVGALLNAALLPAPSSSAATGPAATLVVRPRTAGAAAPSPDIAAAARALLDRAKTATGGALWDTVGSITAEMQVVVDGLTGSAWSWSDPRTGRYAERHRLGPDAGAEGYDGRVAWTQDWAGIVVEREAADRAAALSAAYRDCYGYLLPERFGAAVDLLGERREGERAFDLLRIRPEGGLGFELWLDRQTGLVDRIVRHEGPAFYSVRFADYRTVSGLKLPFELRVTDGQVEYDHVSRVTSLAIDAALPPQVFAPPAAPPPDWKMAEDRRSVAMRFVPINNTILVDARLNGQGPFRLMIDTGGANLISPQLAERLGLPIEGSITAHGVGEQPVKLGLTRLKTVELGKLTLHDQMFRVASFDEVAVATKVPTQGSIGYELFRRLVVEINHDDHELVFTDPAAFEPPRDRQPVPLRFQGRIPAVLAQLDELPGLFTLDTGQANTLTLLQPFVERHALEARYQPKAASVTSIGIGGTALAQVTRARRFAFGPVQMDSPVTYLSQQRSGALADPDVAGNVGQGVLRRYDVTFDYAHRRLYLKRNHHPDDWGQRSWLTVRASNGVYHVLDVRDESPAAEAGLRPGDTIVMVDGADSSLTSPVELLNKFKAKPGTEVRLLVRTQRGLHEMVVTLRGMTI